MNARSGLCAWVRGEVEQHIGSELSSASAQQVLDLADSIVCCDVSFDLLVKLLGGIRPASTWQGGRVAGSAAAGRLGSATGTTAFEDTERAVRVLAPILEGVYVRALGGKAPLQPEHSAAVAARRGPRPSFASAFKEPLQVMPLRPRKFSAEWLASFCRTRS